MTQKHAFSYKINVFRLFRSATNTICCKNNKISGIVYNSTAYESIQLGEDVKKVNERHSKRHNTTVGSVIVK